MADTLYGSLIGLNNNNSGSQVAVDAKGASLEGPQPQPQPQPRPATVTSKSPSPPKEGKSGDDIFAEPAVKVMAAATAPGTAAATAAGATPSTKNKDEVSSAPLPQSFSAAKLMMPPVRKKAEPMANKRPVMPSLDLQKLQEEKEALMRQRAAASEKPASGADSGTTAGLGSGTDDRAIPATASTAPAGSGASSLVASTQSSGATAVSTLLYGSPDEEYDPAKPNDYDEFCRRRMRLKAEEEMERRRQEALARSQQAAKPAEPKEDDFATKMMKKMGWKEGSGLGKDSQGMATPLVLQKTDKAAGKIVEGAKREAPTPQGQPEAKQPKAAPVNRAPTRVLLLNNLVGAGEVDEDLEEETAEEASKYGKIKRCVIKEIKGLPDDQAVRIFLEYERPEDATKALVDMNGRYFGGRVVKARFFDEERFAKGDLDKKGDD
mmetsp:Transcript_106289/g.299047  ORF Transcript_106289/g.299047 Transcript_106289/m.299047 type:complete len:436 (+) Transcript_106289:107-1414(+)